MSIPVLPALLLAALASALYFAYSRWQLEGQRRAFRLKHGCQPATMTYPSKDPFGLTLMFEVIKAATDHKLLDFFHGLHVKYGRTFVTTNWLKPTTILTDDAENIKAALSTKFDDWEVAAARQPSVKPLLGEGIFTTDGKFWAHSRAMLRPAFEKSQVADLEQFEAHIGPLLSHIPEDGSMVDLQNLFHRFSTDTSSEFLLGTSAHSLGRAEQAQRAIRFVNDFDVAFEDSASRARLGLLYYLNPFRRKTNEAIKYVRNFVEDYVESAMKHKASQKAGDAKAEKDGKFVFINELATQEEVDANRIRDETLNVLLAGRDTTASLLSDLWFMLAREPEIWLRLQAEVDQLHGELPTYERLRDMKYLRFVVQETLRCYPPVPILSKVATRDTFLPYGGGKDGQSPLFVAKGDKLLYNMYSMMRQPSVFGQDASTFNPDRWNDPNLRPGWSFLPFGGGLRVCLGQQYALTETYYVTIRLMQKFRRIEKRDDDPWKEKLSVTLSSLNGTKVALLP